GGADASGAGAEAAAVDSGVTGAGSEPPHALASKRTPTPQTADPPWIRRILELSHGSPGWPHFRAHFGRFGPGSLVVQPAFGRRSPSSCCGGGFQNVGSFEACSSGFGSAQHRNEMK